MRCRDRDAAHTARNDRERQWGKRYRSSSPWPRAISPRERHGRHERVSITAETHPTTDVTVVTCAMLFIFLSFLPSLSHSTSLLLFGHSALLSSGQAELYACEISTRNRALNSDFLCYIGSVICKASLSLSSLPLPGDKSLE